MKIINLIYGFLTPYFEECANNMFKKKRLKTSKNPIILGNTILLSEKPIREGEGVSKT